MIRMFPDLQPSIRDAMDRRVIVLDPVKRCDWPHRGDERIALLRLRLGATRSRLNLRHIALWVLWMSVSLIAYLLARSLILQLFPASGLYQALLNFAAICVVLHPLGWLLRPHWIGGSQEIAREVVGEGLCACCGYNLHELTSVPGPIVTCSECGAGWERGWILRSEPFAPGSILGPENRVNPVGRESWTVRDAEGKSVPCIKPPLRVPRGVDQDDPRLRAFRRAGREIADANLPARLLGCGILWSLALGLLAMPAYGMWRDWRSGSGVSTTAIVILAFFTIGCLALIAWSIRGNAFYSTKSVRSAMLRARLCPSCVLDLSLIAPDDRGMCRCTRCRSLWDLPAGRRH